MREGPTTGSFTVKGVTAARAEVLGENRTIPIKDGTFSDDYGPYGLHLYKIKNN
jgi:hypothetical protein